MKNVLVLSLSLLLIGCQTVKPWPNFPDAEESLMKPCEDLKQLPIDTTVTITQFHDSVVDNYSLRHLCANKVEGWQKWYEEQKRIYEDAKKKSQ